MKAEFFRPFEPPLYYLQRQSRAQRHLWCGAYLLFLPLWLRRSGRRCVFYVVDEDNSALSRQLVRYLDSVRAIEVDAVVASPALAVAAVERMQTQGYVLIPKGFERDTLRLGQGQVGLFANGAYLSAPALELGGIAEALRAFAVQSVIKQSANDGIKPPAPPIKLVQRPLLTPKKAMVVRWSRACRADCAANFAGGLGASGGYAPRAVRQAVLRHSQILVSAARRLIASLNVLYYAGFVFWYQDYLPRQPWHGAVFQPAV